MHLETLLADRLAAAFQAVVGRPVDPAVRLSQHADFQSGAALALQRGTGRPPRETAAEVAGRADLDGLATVEVSGPGFLNLTVADDLIARSVEAIDDRLGVPRAVPGERVVIDYSSPNVAKEMQIGHLRSTIIGDALARMLHWLGHDVVRANHLGDWGTKFGLLIEHLVEHGDEPADDRSLGDLTELYRRAYARFTEDAGFAARARLRVVALQNGDELTRSWWRQLVAQTERDLTATYARLGVTLRPADIAGESFYQDKLASVVAELDDQGLLVESAGALCAFPPGFAGRDGQPLPLIVRKSDGGFGYAATDLAALRHRARHLRATRILYVVGAPQRTHLQMVFAVARQAGWLSDESSAEHVEFGSILGTDGKMLRTSAGENVRLSALLDEAEARATSPAVGIGAIKYADLAADRRSDYVFDWDRMLAATGNTGPYLQYAHVRVLSVVRRGAGQPGAVVLTNSAERRLALALLGFEPAVTAAAAHREPHRLASYLHELAVAFSAFYEVSPILRAQPSIRASRLTLADRTARTLRVGTSLLGIDLPDVM